MLQSATTVTSSSVSMSLANKIGFGKDSIQTNFICFIPSPQFCWFWSKSAYSVPLLPTVKKKHTDELSPPPGKEVK